MANSKQRYINTRFWNDNYVSKLDPIEKLLFIYLLTNEHTNISGIYELPLKIMAIETGIDESMFRKILPRLKEKVVYINGYVVIKNFLKHQQTKSNLTVIGITNCLKDLDEKFLKNVISKGYYDIDDSLLQGAYKGLARVSNYSNLDLDSNLDSNSTAEASSASKKPSFSVLGAEILKLFESINPACKKMYSNKTQRSACDFLIETYGFERVKTIIEKTLPKTNGMDYFPRITTPLKLQDKWVDLEVAVKSYQSKKTAEVEKRGHVYI